MGRPEGKLKYGIDLGRGRGKSFVSTVVRGWPGEEFKCIAIDELGDFEQSVQRTAAVLGKGVDECRSALRELYAAMDPQAAKRQHRQYFDELYHGARLPGKTPTPEGVEKLIDESLRDSQREASEDLRPRWLSVRILQLTGLLEAHLGSLTAALAFPWYHGRRSGKNARLQELGHFLPGVQFFSANHLRKVLLHHDLEEDGRALEDDMVTSYRSEKKEAK